MEQIVHLLIALLAVVNTFYQYRTESEVRRIKRDISRRYKNRHQQK